MCHFQGREIGTKAPFLLFFQTCCGVAASLLYIQFTLKNGNSCFFTPRIIVRTSECSEYPGSWALKYWTRSPLAYLLDSKISYYLWRSPCPPGKPECPTEEAPGLPKDRFISQGIKRSVLKGQVPILIAEFKRTTVWLRNERHQVIWSIARFCVEIRIPYVLNTYLVSQDPSYHVSVICPPASFPPFFSAYQNPTRPSRTWWSHQWELPLSFQSNISCFPFLPRAVYWFSF